MTSKEDGFDPTKLCAEAKQKYNACFSRWYRKSFLDMGRPGSGEGVCQVEWNEYERCIKLMLKKRKLEHLLEEQAKLEARVGKDSR
ncbi:hypothetical protein NDN08_004191 [Rhodosorus marinus]|uniref:Mitochondrial distribution and morphology protein 35 n=1 Tax=Rhodosorus marinus TaxID=101924 RepID=A0AAV8UHL5_9RHOD|nr:hypothetical protein NDN08_004191 [Rhodosorus marinus]